MAGDRPQVWLSPGGGCGVKRQWPQCLRPCKKRTTVYTLFQYAAKPLVLPRDSVAMEMPAEHLMPLHVP